MKNIFSVLLLCFSCTHCLAQFTGLEGTWLGDKNAFMLIADSSKPDMKFVNFIANTAYSGSGMAEGSEVFCNGDTLSFRSWDSRKYDLRIINQTDTTLILLPVSELSIHIFRGEDTLRLSRQKKNRLLDPSFKFEKIVYRIGISGGPPGVCHFQLDSTRWIKLYASDYLLYGDDYFKKSGTAHEGYFVGQVSDSLYKELLFAMQDANLEKLKMSEDMCCDGAITTLIIYYNGRRKYFETMQHPPIMAESLFNMLYDICRHHNVPKTTEKFELER